MNVQFISLLILLSFTRLYSQPVNPVFNFSTEIRFDIDMQAIAIMDIESGATSVDFTLSTPIPDEAGVGLGSNPISVNNSTWLNYSCANRDVLSRHIEVSIASGSVPDGLELHVLAGNSIGMGGGVTGISTGSDIVLGNTAQTIISGIEGCFTGDGPNNGHQLTYSLHYIPQDFNLLIWQDQEIVVMYTIVDD